MINLKEFKQSVLQQAMQGELTKQLSSDGNASDLLVKIANKKRDLVQSGKLKGYSKSLPPVTDKEEPFSIPDNWEWTRLANFYRFINGYQPKKNKCIHKNKSGYIRLYLISDYTEHSKHWYIPTEYAKRISRKNDILIANVGASLGRIFKAKNGAYNGHLVRVLPISNNYKLNKFYVWYYLHSNIYQSFVHSIEHSKLEASLSKKNFRQLIIPVPPLSEQKRIVAKVHKCFELADTIQKERELNKKFAHEMKQSLLQQAMEGHLTKQLPSDGTSNELLKQIKQKKQELIKAGKIHRHKKLPPISKKEISSKFNIPKNWKWVRLGNIGSWKSGSTPRRSNKSYYLGNIPWLKTGDLNDSYITRTSEHISGNALNHSSLRLNPKGSVLIAMYGVGTIGKLGIATVPLTTNQACCACIPYLINNKFLFYYLLLERNNFNELRVGVGSHQNISRTRIVHHLFPLPPLIEQKRIVIKLKSIFSLLSIY